MGRDTVQKMMNPTGPCQYHVYEQGAVTNLLNSFVCMPAFGPNVFFML